MDMQKNSRFYVDMALIILSCSFGGCSLILFGFFLFFNGFDIISVPLSHSSKLVWNSALSLIFFLQHSVMVRARFKAKLDLFLSPYRRDAVYSICSGLILSGLVVLWQSTHSTLYTIPYPATIVFRCVFFLMSAPFLLSLKALGNFDSLGIRNVLFEITGKRRTVRPVELALKGPYRWVRHPIYMASIILIWSTPLLTTDRILLNITWTLWICLGAYLEDGNLKKEFGAEYIDYCRRVPMIFPRSIRPAI
jgi:methanethiol S-methyltransferase